MHGRVASGRERQLAPSDYVTERDFGRSGPKPSQLPTSQRPCGYEWRTEFWRSDCRKGRSVLTGTEAAPPNCKEALSLS
jgi:hypothetical protein